MGSTSHNATVGELIEAAGCELHYLPIYSPDYNPTKHVFARLKAFVRKPRADTVPDLIRAFEDAVLTVIKENTQNAFAHCGYLS